MMKQALMIVDMQEAFFNHPENFLYQSDLVVNNINGLIEQARQKDIPVIFIQHTTQDEQDEFFEGSDDWQIHKGLLRSPADKLIQKTRWDAFYQTELLDYLKANGIEQLIIAGAQTEFCLDTTIRAAYSLGFQNNILYKNTQSTISSTILKADEIIRHHESIWNNRFLSIKECGE